MAAKSQLRRGKEVAAPSWSQKRAGRRDQGVRLNAQAMSTGHNYHIHPSCPTSLALGKCPAQREKV